MKPYRLSAGAVVARTLLASLGGYLLALGFSAGAAALLTRLFGMVRGEAFVLTAMLAFLAWPLAVLVAYAAKTGWRATAWIIGGAVFWAGLAYVLGPLPAAGSM